MGNRAGNISLDVPKFLRITPAGAWTRQAACLGTDPEMWFVEDDGTYREARLICAACPVRSECLAWALETRTEHGLFGGLAPRERRQLRRRGAVQLELAGDHARVDEVRPSGRFL